MDREENRSGFSPDGKVFEFSRGPWPLGLILALAFSPFLYIACFRPDKLSGGVPTWAARLIAGLIYLAALHVMGMRRRVRVDGSGGYFTLERTFFWVFHRRLEGSFGRIQEIGLSAQTTRDEESNRFRRHATLWLAVDSSQYALQEGGADPQTGKRLAELIGCPFKDYTTQN